MLHIKLIKSPIGNNARNRRTVAALGLRKMHQTVIHNDTPSIRGMIHHVKHMLSVTEGPAPEATAPVAAPKKAEKSVAAKPTKAADAKPKAEAKPKTVKKTAKKESE